MARILVIDDDYQILQTLHQVLALEGHEVMDASNGKEGLERFREHGADLVITDIVMPEKEGLETIMELRKAHPGVQIIAISGGGQIDPDAYLKMATQFGAVRALPKPFGREELLEAVRSLLDERLAPMI
jgi:DNA-binding NtrC family response regulator